MGQVASYKICGTIDDQELIWLRMVKYLEMEFYQLQLAILITFSPSPKTAQQDDNEFQFTQPPVLESDREEIKEAILQENEILILLVDDVRTV